ncbi:TonB-dependent receptor [Parathalassolituus penaei]|uniref:TonB-dependent receptor n=1 Tax=Parathalassolituus penaei TaxID=2997323 RepID=A0A9X3EG29_9GAMM|nr:TonB-dependent receptor [Parathalassolituus penaei]MCY0966100.1 TonB-dependent receptor [Parathalassolituus penaei]
MLRYVVPGLVSALVVPACVNAGESSNPAVEEVVVTLTPGDKSPEQLAQSSAVLSGDELQRQKAASLGETLSQQAGIASSGYGAAVSRPVIRGLGGSRVAVLENGMDAVDASSISPDHAVAVQLQGASQIEVLRGPATLLYGSGAFGGVVNLVANDDQPLPEGGLTTADVQYQTVNDGTALGLRHEQEDGPWRWNARINQNRAGEYRIPSDATDDGDKRLPNSDIDLQQEVAAGGRYQFEGGSAGVELGWLKSGFGLPGHEHHHEEEDSADADHEEHEEEGAARVALVQRRVQSDLKLEAPVDGVQQLDVRLALTDYQHAEGHEGSDTEAGSKTLFERDVQALRVETLLEPIADWEHRVGVQLSHEDFAASGSEALVPETDTRIGGLFWLGEHQWQDWTWQLGARLDRQRTDPAGGSMLAASAVEDLCGFEVDDTRARVFANSSWSAGFLRDFNGGWQVASSVTSAHHAPGAEELYSCGAHDSTLTYDVGNPDLAAEKSLNLDLALRRTEGDWQGSVAVYQNRVRDFTYQSALQDNGSWVTVDEFQAYRYEQADARLTGAEAQLSWQQTEAWQWQWMADRVRGKFVEGGYLPRMPADRVGMGLNYEDDFLNGFVQGYRVLKQDRLASWGSSADGELQETSTDGYWLLNAGVGYYLVRPEAEYQLSLRANNLLNEVIRYHTSFVKDTVPQPGRNFTLGLSASF